MKKLKRIIFLVFSLLYVFSIPIYAQNVIYSSNINAGKRIALTFDDGPHPKITSKVLKILQKYDVKATFFVIGINAKRYPDDLKQIVLDGHEIGNHTYSHNILKSMSKEEIEKEISDTERQVEEIASYNMSLLRPPCGLYDDTLVDIAREKGLKIVLWAVDTNDWAHQSTSSITKNVIRNAKNGDIVLFHDYVSGIYNTPEALEIIIPALQKMGYEFVTISELLQNAS